MKKQSIKGIVILLFCFFVFKPLVAQDLKEFSTDTAQFIDQFEEFIKRNISEQEEDSLDVFLDRWEAGGFSVEVKDRFIEVCNLLLKNKARRNPHFTKYFDLVLTFHNDQEDLKNYDDWEMGLRFLLENVKNPLRPINTYFNNTKTLIVENCIYKTYSTSWYVSDKNFTIKADKELQIVFDQTNLFCKIKSDSISIHNTEGVFYPTTNRWNGKKGIVTWERAGYAREEVYAELDLYRIDLTKSGFKADSAFFINRLYFDEPILGQLSDQVVHVTTPERAVYPEFNSYQKRFKIANIFPNIDYEGGFSMKGANLLGSGDREDEAFLKIVKEEKTILKAFAETFMFRKNRVVSNDAQVTINFENDSIYHPGIMFSFLADENEISLSPSDRIVSKSPYYDSYHEMSMSFDRLLWNIDQDKIYLTKKRGGDIGNATFTSSNFYNLVDFERIMLRDDFHPLLAIKRYAGKINSQTFSGTELAHFLSYDVYQIKQMLMFLSVDGFIFYDTDNDIATINSKLYEYVDARFGRIDYDVMRFNSTTSGLEHNGVIDLTTKDLIIKGVPRIFLSDSQNVAIYPKNKQIVMKKNRDFSFGGVVDAGLFTFFGQDFYFEYDTFKIKLNNIDSLSIQVQTEEYDLYNRAVLANIKNTIENVTGNLLIDHPQNKSGLQNFPQYPVFNSLENSFIYYDDYSIQKGVYQREDFYFQLEPFSIDSLDNFTTKGLHFEGRFYSANIFPPFDDAVYMRPDYSLGFRRQTPPEGFPLYEGKGKYFNMIDLSNRGLRGSGTLEYLTSTAETDSIIFYPDSTKIHARNFTLAQRTSGIEYPKLESSEIDIKWYPYQDVMYADQTNEPFGMYNPETKFSGSLTLKPIGLVGRGTMDLEKATLQSGKFYFDANAFNADTTSFNLKSLDRKEVNFITENLKGEIDFAAQSGTFQSNESFTIARFPKNLYVSYLDQFAWDMAGDEIAIESSPQVDSLASPEIRQLAELKDDQLPGALYMSTHLSQDSLRFASTKAVYRLKDSTIHATEVEYLKVADANIYPSEGDITIGHQANMKTLFDAEIIANRTSRYHRIYQAKLNVRARNNYTGSGEYDYVDENDQIQVIHFTNIFVDTSLQTKATGSLDKEQDFTLSPVFNYRGNVELNAARKYLTFKGGVKMDFECPLIPKEWAYFESEINPDSIYIPVPREINNTTGRGLYSSPFITKDSSHIYTTFLSQRRDPNDEPIVSAHGFLHYNKSANKYIITDQSKFLNPDTIGSLVDLQRDFCLYHGEGQINLGIDLGQIDFNPAGTFTHKLDNNEIRLELILPLDFFFSGAALDSLRKDINSLEGLDPLSITSPFFEKYLTEIVGPGDYNEFNNQLTLYANEAKLPQSTQHTLLLGNLRVKWYTELGSYLNEGKIGIATINNKPVNKYVDGYFQLLKRRSGDIMKFYFKLPNNHYYYFSYTRGVMQTLSNNEKFLNAIQEIKRRKRKLKTKRGETPYRYIIATDQNLAQFLRNMRLFEEAQAAEQERLQQEQQQKQTQPPLENKNESEEKNTENKN
ncbi:MAG: hypothetical protein V2I54_00135 [Bacteroidales bacterium]|jgi:hypothetical protein|nr:hypothetical protein [Bacteroidales bacterium]